MSQALTPTPRFPDCAPQEGRVFQASPGGQGLWEVEFPLLGLSGASKMVASTCASDLLRA